MDSYIKNSNCIFLTGPQGASLHAFLLPWSCRKPQASPQMTANIVPLFLILFFLIYTDNSFLTWAQHYAELQNQTACWIHGILPVFGTSGLPWWVSPSWGIPCVFMSQIWPVTQVLLYFVIALSQSKMLPSGLWSVPPGIIQAIIRSQTSKVLTESTRPQMNTHQRMPKR